MTDMETLKAARPEPKFKVGQVVVTKGIKKELPFRILFATWGLGEWFYGWNSRQKRSDYEQTFGHDI